MQQLLICCHVYGRRPPKNWMPNYYSCLLHTYSFIQLLKQLLKCGSVLGPWLLCIGGVMYTYTYNTITLKVALLSTV